MALIVSFCSLAWEQTFDPARIEVYTDTLAALSDLVLNELLDVRISAGLLSALWQCNAYPQHHHVEARLSELGISRVSALDVITAANTLFDRAGTVEGLVGVTDVLYDLQYIDPDIRHEEVACAALSMDTTRMIGILLVANCLDRLPEIQIFHQCGGRTSDRFVAEGQVHSAEVDDEEINYVPPVSARIEAPIVCAPSTLLNEAVFESIHDGSELWERREALFPDLQFCDAVQDTVAQIGTNNPLLHHIARKLAALNKVANEWTSGPFPRDALPFRVSPESERTLNQYGGFRDFVCPDGLVRRFVPHARLTPQEWRIHFLEEKIDGKLVIGYIGPHLPIASEG